MVALESGDTIKQARDFGDKEAMILRTPWRRCCASSIASIRTEGSGITRPNPARSLSAPCPQFERTLCR
jgi:hypothetical protein